VPGSHDNRRAHIDQICMHQQLSRNWQLAAQIGGPAGVLSDFPSLNVMLSIA
jgi:hypothetical protein